MWFSFYAIFRKELLHLRRDPSTVRLVLFVPLIQLWLFGSIDQTVHDVATVVVDQDRSTESRLFIDGLKASRTFKVIALTTSPEEARSEIRSGHARVAVVIPPRFHGQRVRPEPAQILVLIDGSDSTLSAQALASVNGLVSARNLPWNATVGPSIAVQPVILFNPEGRTANYIIPGLISVLLMTVGLALAAGSIVVERERGTFEQLLVTPIHPVGLVLGKLAPYLGLGLLEMAIVLLAMRFGFQVPIRGSIFLLFAMAILYLMPLFAMGLLISTRATTQMESMQISQSLMLPSVLLSGYIFPFESLPLFLKALGSLLPTTYMIRIMRGIILRDATLMDLLPDVAVLGGMCVVMVLAAARSIRKVAQ